MPAEIYQGLNSREQRSKIVKAPITHGSVAFWANALAVVVLVFGVVAIRDSLVRLNLLSGDLWLERFVRTLDQAHPIGWTIFGGVLTALIGVNFVWLSLRVPRAATMRLGETSPVFIRPSQVARISSHVAVRVDGVLAAKAVASRRLVVVTLHTTGGENISAEVARAVTEELSILNPTPKIKIKTNGGERSA
jgi:hypothetical protein